VRAARRLRWPFGRDASAGRPPTRADEHGGESQGSTVPPPHDPGCYPHRPRNAAVSFHTRSRLDISR
jgi:hypothetical protein